MTTCHTEESWASWMDELSHNDYLIIDQFLPPTILDEVRAHFVSQQPNFTPAGIGALDKHAVRQEIRGDLTFWLDRPRDAALNGFWELIDETIHVFNRFCFLSLSGYEFHYALYPPGGHYDVHLDQFQGRNNRMISMVLYLNRDWKKGDGGQLEVFDRNGDAHLIEPLNGRCVFFKSAEVPHRVLESKADRLSLTGWLLYQPAALGQFFG